MDFFLGKGVDLLLDPMSLCFILLLVTSILVASRRRAVQLVGQNLCGFLVFALFLVAVLPVGAWALLPLENKYQAQFPEKVDGIIMLAGGEEPLLTEGRGQPVVAGTIARYVTFAEMARKYPAAKLVFSGGYPDGKTPKGNSNASVAKLVLNQLNLKTDEIVFEDLSRTTFENAHESAVLLKPTSDQNWLLVTSAYHMPRSILAFRKAGFTVYPVPADYWTSGSFSLEPRFDILKHMVGLRVAMHEYTGLISYWLLGRTSSLWPA